MSRVCCGALHCCFAVARIQPMGLLLAVVLLAVVLLPECRVG
jgi:hypothetical protein